MIRLIEEWRTVPGHPDYEVSSLGRVRSWKRNRWGRSDEPRYLKCSPSKHGYPRANLEERYYAVHLLVLEAFAGPRPEGRVEGAHRNGIKTDNRVENLYWATPKQNGADNARLGVLKGEKHPLSKLTDKRAQAARELYALGHWTIKDLAEVLNVSPHSIQRVLAGNGWTHVA